MLLPCVILVVAAVADDVDEEETKVDDHDDGEAGSAVGAVIDTEEEIFNRSGRHRNSPILGFTSLDS